MRCGTRQDDRRSSRKDGCSRWVVDHGNSQPPLSTISFVLAIAYQMSTKRTRNQKIKTQSGTTGHSGKCPALDLRENSEDSNITRSPATAHSWAQCCGRYS